MQRRGFLQALAAAAAGFALDPDNLLWVPGRKLISVPKPVAPKIGDLIHARLPDGYIYSTRTRMAEDVWRDWQLTPSPNAHRLAPAREYWANERF